MSLVIVHLTYLLTTCGSDILKLSSCSVHDSCSGLCMSHGTLPSIRARAADLQWPSLKCWAQLYGVEM